MKKLHMLVIGFSGTHCSDRAYEIAYRVGEEMTEHGATLLTRGLEGVKEAASKGVKSKRGLLWESFPRIAESARILITTLLFQRESASPEILLQHILLTL